MQLVLDQLTYFGFLQSIFLLGIYTFSSKSRKNLNSYLIILVLVLFIGLSGKVFYSLGISGKTYRLIAISEYATFLFGATVYLFTRSSLTGVRLSKKDLLHYLPGIAYILVISFYYLFASDELVRERIQSGELFQAVVVFMGAGLVFNSTYWLMSFRLFQSYRKKMMDEVSFAVKSQFFRNFLLAIGLCLSCWLIVYLIGVFGQSWLERSVRPFIWLSLSFIILFIAYYGLKEPDLYKVAPLIKAKKYLQSKLSVDQLKELKEKLDQLMEEKKPYLNRNLMKADLAEMLGVNNPEVARLLNEQIGMNFFEYVNYFRIKEFIELAKTEKAKTLTFFGLAQEAGFNSKTTFNKSFKKIMGTSPSEYFAQGPN
ncbi:MAG: helix-turn-helix domain-containing protein [Bacteroidota bacterium]